MPALWDDHGAETLVQARTTSSILPIVLCAPHGGNAADGTQADTLLERPCCPLSSATAADVATGSGHHRHRGGINLTEDVGTARLCEEIDRRLTKKCGGLGVGTPAVVIARFHRMYVDANRSLDDERAVAVHPCCPKARELHEHYHASVAAAVEAAVTGIRQRPRGSSCESAPRVLLIDIHGQQKYPDKILIGSCNGGTVDLHALNAVGTGFLWHLRRALVKYTARVNCDDPLQEHATARIGNEAGSTNEECVLLPPPGHEEIAGYTGGYTVQRHGRMTSQTVDAIQLEFGRRFRRTSDVREATAEAVAQAVHDYLLPLAT